jgi:acetyl-CoA acetyltransferase
MFGPFLRTLVKVIVASLVVGTILQHFGITAEQLMSEFGLSAERIEDYARRGISWALPNVLLGAMIIVPIWFVVYLFRPPGQSRSD